MGSHLALDTHLSNWHLAEVVGGAWGTSELTGNRTLCSADVDPAQFPGGCEVACHLRQHDQGQKQLGVGGTCQSPSVLTSSVREKMPPIYEIDL